MNGVDHLHRIERVLFYFILDTMVVWEFYRV